MIVNTDVDELPADAAAVALTGVIAGDAVADLVEAAELFDVDVDHLARRLALITAHRLGRLQVAHPVQSQAAQDAAYGGRRHPTSAAMCLPVWRCRRNVSMTVHVAGAVWLGSE